MEVEFNGKYDQATLYRAVKLISKPTLKSTILRYTFFCVFLGLYIYLVVNATNSANVSTYQMSRLMRHLVSLICLGYLLIKPAVDAKMTASRIWKKSISMRLPARGGISSQGVRYGIGDDQGEIIPWNKYIKKCFTDDLLVLMTDNLNISFFPRRFFVTDQDWQMAREYMEEKVVEPIKG